VDYMQVDTPDEAYVAALLREREGYVRKQRGDRVAGVDAELKRLGVTREDAHRGEETAVSAPAERAVPSRGRRSGRG
jgi:hypothetical protein